MRGNIEILSSLKTDHKRNKLVSEPNSHTVKLISENLSIIEMKKVKVKMNKPIYLGLSILEISKIIMYEKEIWRYGKVMLYRY